MVHNHCPKVINSSELTLPVDMLLSTINLVRYEVIQNAGKFLTSSKNPLLWSMSTVFAQYLVTGVDIEDWMADGRMSSHNNLHTFPRGSAIGVEEFPSTEKFFLLLPT